MYSLYLLFFTAFATVINSSEFTKWLTGTKIWEDFCCSIDQDESCLQSDPNSRINITEEVKEECEQLLGATGVYLVYLSMAIFFVMMAMATANLRHSHQFRATLHNGFWLWKFLIISGLFVGLYVGIAYNGVSTSFLEIWKWIALIFGSLFIFWQMTVFVNFAYDWGKSWGQAAKRSPSKTGTCCWYMAIAFFSFILICATAGCYLILYYSFTKSPSGVVDQECEINKWFIVASASAGALLLAIALIPCGSRARTRTPMTGILQASLVACYIMYLTFSAINAQKTIDVPLEQRPENWTEPSCIERCFSLPDLFVDWLESHEDSTVDDFIASINSPCSASANTSTILSVVFNYVAIALTLFLTIYSAMTSTAITTKDDDEKPPLFCCCYSWEFPEMDAMDVRGQDVIEDDYERLSYRYWSFHLIYAAASMYLMMTITNWFTPTDNLEDRFETSNATTFWIKTATTCVITLIYIMALIAPLFCPRSWFSHQLDGNAGQIDENSIGVGEPDLEIRDDEIQKNPYNSEHL